MKNIVKLGLTTLVVASMNPLEGGAQITDTSMVRVVILVKKSILEDLKEELKLYAEDNNYFFRIFNTPTISKGRLEYLSVLAPREPLDPETIAQQKEDARFIESLASYRSTNPTSEQNTVEPMPLVHVFTPQEVGFPFDKIIFNGQIRSPNPDGTYWTLEIKKGDIFILVNTKMMLKFTRKF